MRSQVRQISPRPILLMHGTQDDLVPVVHSERIYEKALEPKQLWIAEDAWHCALFDKHPKEFREIMYHGDVDAVLLLILVV